MDETHSARSNRNEYNGLAAGPLKRTGAMKLRLDFNSRLALDTKTGKIDGFSLRLMERPEDIDFPEPRMELAVQMTVEQWQDLIAAMQAELDLARKTREEWEAEFGGEEP